MLNYMVPNRRILYHWTLKSYQHLIYDIEKTKMSENFNVRWAFNAKCWVPTKDEILAASSFVQSEEKQRISRYYFQKDAKSTLIGRLMMRKFAHLATSIPYEDIKLLRDDRGKPYLVHSGGDIPSVNFNVSHHGSLVVLAGHATKKIGIDLMDIEPLLEKNLTEFFSIMNRQFSPHEWETIWSFSTDQEQASCFNRLWCLKESYVKNIGVGITIPLKEISFSIKTCHLEVGKYVTDTELYVNNVRKTNWVFEETLVDDQHIAAVSLHIDDGKMAEPVPYRFLTFSDLVEEAIPSSEPDEPFANDFLRKK